MQETPKLTSPDQLNNYIRVTSSGIWIVLAAILVLIAGLFMWLFTGQLEISLHTPIFTIGPNSYAFIPLDELQGITPGSSARIGSSTGKVTALSSEPMTISEIDAVIGRNNAAMLDNSSRSLWKVSMNIPGALDGVSRGVIVIATVRPITFLLR